MPGFISELPVWIALVTLVAGIALFITGSKRLDIRLRQVGFAVAALGLILGLLSHFLESDREAVQRRTRELVKAVEARDWTAARSYLHPQFSFRAGDTPGRTGPDAAIKLIQNGVEFYGLTQASATSDQPEYANPTALNPTIALAVRIYTEGTGGSGLTNWTFEWLKSDDTWLLSTAEFLGGPLVPPGEVERRLQRP